MSETVDPVVEPTAEPTVEPVVQPATEPTPVDLREQFMSALPEGKRKTFEKYKNAESLVNGILAAQELIGKKGDIPPEGATEEQLSEFWGKLSSSDLAPSEYEYGEEYGDLAEELKQEHSAIDAKITELLADALKTARTLPELKQAIVGKFLDERAQEAKRMAIELSQARQEAIKALAGKYGTTANEFGRIVKETINREGWGADTSVEEIVYKFAKANAGPSPVTDSHFADRTVEGIDQQIATISASDEYLKMEGPQHNLAVEKLTKLLQAKFDLEQK